MLFNIPYTCEESIENVRKLITNPEKVSSAEYLEKCMSWFRAQFPGYHAYMTTSCTRALELITLSLNLSAEDEIILSPYTYVGVGNAFSNYNVKLAYVDIDPATMNINANLIEAAITAKTKAVIAMHYAGIPCEMEKIKDICDRHQLLLIEDCAQSICASYNGRLLGSYGDFSCFSFDMLKNISCYEGGVMLCKSDTTADIDVAYFNGTNKTAFSKGLVNKYEWVGKGSKFAMSEYTAAVLYPLLLKSDEITEGRKKVWKSLFNKIQKEESLRQYIPQKLMDTSHNAHLAYLKFKNAEQRNNVLKAVNARGIPCSFHYIPLDDSEEGKKHAVNQLACVISKHESECLLRLPVHNFLTEVEQDLIVSALADSIQQ